MEPKGLWQLPEPCGHSPDMEKGHLILPLAHSLPRCPASMWVPFPPSCPASSPPGPRWEGCKDVPLVLLLWTIMGSHRFGVWGYTLLPVDLEYPEPSECGLARQAGKSDHEGASYFSF